MAALFPIEPVIHAAEEGERTIETLMELGDPLSIDAALFIADQTIDTLIGNIVRRVFTPEEKQVMAEHLTALGIVAIGRTDDIIHTLTNVRGIDTDGLMEKLCEMRLSFAASEYDEVDWIESFGNGFPPEEGTGTDR